MSIPILPDDYFFVNDDYAAFDENKVKDNSPEVLDERRNVRAKLEDLHERIYPLIKSKRWDIDKHYSPGHLTSSIDLNSSNTNKISSLWLHYGKPEKEIKKFKDLRDKRGEETFINHARLQVIISGNLRSSTLIGVGAWLVIGKSDGSRWDRDYIQRNLNDTAFVKKFYNEVFSLGADYFIRIGEHKRTVTSLGNLNDFTSLIKKDKLEEYFIIGKDFAPDAQELKDDIIEQTIIDEFSKLYPIYQMIKFPI